MPRPLDPAELHAHFGHKQEFTPHLLTSKLEGLPHYLELPRIDERTKALQEKELEDRRKYFFVE